MKIPSLLAVPFMVFWLAASLYALDSKMPEGVILDTISERYGAVSFNHSLHTMIAENCSLCHHQHPVSDAASCRQCHDFDSSVFKGSLVSSFLSCRSCHSKFDPANPGVPGLKEAYHQKCLQCHRGMDNVGLDPKGCTGKCHIRRESTGVTSGLTKSAGGSR